ncbi:MAG: galactose-1-epimerase [Desulfovibrio sp.]|nr:galactose-1-epimerase [Desulfovibrio sp.]|tara:strand:+ start:483 stop:1538 length:1056 start_codon:yes stop_codon:yes gene_type:complete
MEVVREKWGQLKDGRWAERFTLSNARGMQAVVTNYGATLIGLTAPDNNGNMTDVVLGFDTLDEYVHGRGYFGATIGRVANRLSGGSFMLDGKIHDVVQNKDGFQIHGGAGGFHSRLWEAEIRNDVTGSKLILSYRSEDGEEGYPGNVDVQAVFSMIENGLRMEYRAATDTPTVLTMTNHAYFNLSGRGADSILDHVVTLNASGWLPTDEKQIPTGEVAEVAGTPLDFSRPTAIGLRIDESFPPLELAHGYDHFYIIDGDPCELTPAAQIFHGGSGRVLEVCTTQPGLQFYTGNHMADRINGKLGVLYGPRSGFCVETQGYVDAPNRPEFPAVTLRPGETYHHVTEYRFSNM